MPHITTGKHAQKLQLTAEALREGLTASQIAERLGCAPRTARDLVQKAKAQGITAPPATEITRPKEDQPEDPIDLDELLKRRSAAFRRKDAIEKARKLIQVKVNVSGPIAIHHFGDPHLDDDGTDIDQLSEHCEIINRTEGMLAANIGDTTNNWVGRLARLYASQTTTAREAFALAEWFINTAVRKGKWLYIIGGNHDLWSGAGDPLQWIAKIAEAPYSNSEARIQLNFPNGTHTVVNARHEFVGSSQWNPAHGPMKAAQLGLRDEIMIAGHLHKSGYGIVKDPESGKVCHTIQVASYKIYDRYAKEKGFRDQSVSPCVVTVIDPDNKGPDHVHVFWEPEPAADYLGYLRSRRATRKRR